MKILSRHSLFFLFFLFASVGLLLGCKKANLSTTKQQERTLKENTITLNFSEGDIPSLDPHDLIMTARGQAMGKWLFEGLMRVNPQGEYELAGAEKIDISPCHTKYTFTLRTNHYSDGSAVSAYDYERSWKRALAPNSNCAAANLFYCIRNAEKVKKQQAPLESVAIKALDNKTLYVELNYPTSHFLSLLASPLFAPHKREGKEFLGSGPYKIHKWKRENYLQLVPNPFFWDQEHISISKVAISMVKDEMTSLQLYEQGEIDWIGSPFSPLPLDALYKEISCGNLAKKEVIYPFWLYVNTEHFPLSSPLIRRALSMVINRQLIAENIFIGGSPLSSPLPNSNPAEPFTICLTEAKKLFADGMKELGLTQKSFPPLKLSHCHLATHKKVAEYLQETWTHAFGIQVDLDGKEWNTFYYHLRKGEFDLGGCFFGNEYDDPLACFERLAYKNNFSRWENKQYQSLIEQARKEIGAEKSHLLKELEVLLRKEMPIIWLVNKPKHYSYRKDLRRVAFDYRLTPDLRFAYLEK